MSNVADILEELAANVASLLLEIWLSSSRQISTAQGPQA